MNNQEGQQHTTAPGFLKIWQVVELVLLFLLIPGTFGLAVILNGDDGQNKIFHGFISFILPVLVAFLLLKIVVTVAFFKGKKWTFYFNFVESIILLVFFALQVILIIYAGFTVDNFSILKTVFSLIFPVLFALLFWNLTVQYKRMMKSIDESEYVTEAG